MAADHSLEFNFPKSASFAAPAGFAELGAGLGEELKGSIGPAEAPEAPKGLPKAEFDRAHDFEKNMKENLGEKDIDLNQFDRNQFSKNPRGFVGGFDNNLTVGANFGKGAIDGFSGF